jgi:Leucine rich repeat
MMAPSKMAVYLLVILLLRLGSVDAQSKKDRAGTKEHQSADQERPVATLENVCDIRADTLGMYCYCDSLNLHDAHKANCWVNNATSQTDLIWHSFQTQPQLKELRLNGQRNDGRLTFVPTSALQHLGNLSILEVAYADINVLEANSFIGLATVRNLSLKRNNVTFSPISFLPFNSLTEKRSVLEFHWARISLISFSRALKFK